MKILIVSPHPDDAEIALGAFIYRHAHNGHDLVDIAVCTGRGDLNMVHSKQTVTFEERRQEQQEAADILGVNEVIWLDLGAASKFDLSPQSDFVSAFDKLFGDYEQVYIPLPSYNRDHTIVFDAAMASMRCGKIDFVSIYAYEQAFGNAVGPQLTGTNFGKRYLLASSGDMQKKMLALYKHQSQMQGRLESIYGPGGCTKLMELRGAEVGYPLAELVYMIRTVD